MNLTRKKHRPTGMRCKVCGREFVVAGGITARPKLLKMVAEHALAEHGGAVR